QASAGVFGRPGAALPARGASGILGPGGVRRTQTQRLGHGLLQREAAGKPLQGVAGSLAPVLSPAQGVERAVYPGWAALRYPGPGAARSGRLASERPLLRPARRRSGAGRILPRSLLAHGETQRRMDGRV